MRSVTSNLVFFLLLSLTASYSTAFKPKGASITVKARFNATSYLLEAVEFLAEEDGALVWPFLERMIALGEGDGNSADDDANSDERCWRRIVDEAAALVTSSVGKMLPLSLGSRQYAAKLQMVRELAAQDHPGQTACCFVSVDGRTAVSPEELAPLLAAPPSGEEGAEQLFAFDHIYGGGGSGSGAAGSAPRRTALLYGSPGLACFGPLYRALATAANASAASSAPLLFAYRPLLQPQCEAAAGCGRPGCGGPLLLPGWGAEAALKNTEYSAVDDKAKQQQSDEGAEGAAADDPAAVFGSGEAAVVRGFRLDVLAARRPGARSELLTFRDTLRAAEEDEGADIKVWDLKDVGLAAAERIAASADPLALLGEVAGNFPGLVASLSRQPVNASLRSSVTRQQQALAPGTSLLLVNGLAVDVADNLDFYGLLSRFRSEARLRDALAAQPLLAAGGGAGGAGGVLARLMALRAEEGGMGAAGGGGGAGGGGSDGPRVDLGSAATLAQHVAWLNDLEKDPRLTRHGRSVTELLNTYPGRFRPLARNVFSIILIAQPLCAPALEMAAAAEQLQAQGYPIRFGVVFRLPSVLARVTTARRYPYLSQPAPTWEEMPAAERLGRAFETLREAFGAPAAWALWTRLGEAVAEGDLSEPAELVESAFRDAWAAAAAGGASPRGARAKAAARKSGPEALKMLQAGTGYAAEAGMRLAESASWLLSKGLAQPPSAASADADAGAADDDDPESCSEAPLLTWLNGQLGRPASAQELLYKTMGEMQQLQEWVYFQRLTDETAGGDVLAAVLQLSGAVGRHNPRLVGPTAEKAQFLPLAPLLAHPAAPGLRPLWRDGGADGDKAGGKEGGKDGAAAAPRPHALPPVTHHVVADLASAEGRGLVAEALRFLTDLPAGRDARLVLLSNPARPAAPPSLLEAVTGAALAQAEPEGNKRGAVAAFLARLLGDAALVTRLAGPLRQGSAEEAGVAVAYANEAGLDGNRMMGFLMRVAEAGLSGGGGGKPGGAGAPPPALPGLAFRAQQGELVRAALGLAPGAAAVLSNGRLTRVHTPGGETHELVAEDFALLQLLAASLAAPGAAAAAAISRAHGEGRFPDVPAGLTSPRAVDTLADLAAAVTATLGAHAAEAAAAGGSGGGGRGEAAGAGSKGIQAVMERLRDKAVQIPGDPDSPLHLEVALNPLSRPAQRLAGLLQLLRATLATPMTLLLNPQRDITDMPLRSYYRYAYPQFASAADPASPLALGPPAAPAAYFARLPPRRVLTLNMEAPESWLLEPATAAHDLDNLVLADIEGEVAYAEYELDAVMLTGSCVDVTASGRMTPPRGLQLHLGTPAAPHTVDTLVMANLAYFQLKAAPGRWVLSLAPGRSRELYTLEPSTGPGEGEGAAAGGALAAAGGGAPGLDPSASTQVVISSFQGKHMVLRVRKRPGREGEDVLSAAGEGQEGSGLAEMDDEYDEYGSKPSASVPAARGGDTINVFTVASGHMYERLQKIMILSVLRHTQHKVKFWIIKNYMSPQHRRVIPALAQQYGFEYEFVTYKWPHWLHKQTDKQRLIWAYKILFLDVLFPLDVPRIIFVDSDQVVRTDLAELYHMDIKGAPYAYTPFCDNNRETDEYRFWKGGFWRDHLQGKPYHISALYLVDLQRFRQIAAGDQLRVVYDQLSRDPNSLANLDQDLPNYAQHSIRIHSLPQEWLWCESWCGNATKERAKTIDLCNNPKTKEPKLTAARRIIGPLWEQLDAQQEAVTREVQLRLEAEETGAPLPPPPAPAPAAEGDAEGAAGAGAPLQPPEGEQQQQQQQEGAGSWAEEDAGQSREEEAPRAGHDPTEL